MRRRSDMFSELAAMAILARALTIGTVVVAALIIGVVALASTYAS
jgi:hypothetical protein